MCVLGYFIIGLALFVFVQSKNVYPQLLLARLFFSIGAAAAVTMVTAILPAMTAPVLKTEQAEEIHPSQQINGQLESTSISSELTITPARLGRHVPEPPKDHASISQGLSPTRLAGVVGMFTGSGALVALGGFLRLPTVFQKGDVTAGQALADSYYVVGAIAILLAACCFYGLRELNGDAGKSWSTAFGLGQSPQHSPGKGSIVPYHKLVLESVLLGLKDDLIGLGYLGGFVARASSVCITLFIPLFVNNYFISSGICKIDDPVNAKIQCHEAYILAAKLTGTSQLVALIFAPIFGFLADKYRRFHIPLLAASLCGIVGYAGLAALDSPETSGKSGSPLVYLIVALLGISQIGCIVCSLGLLGRGISGLEDSNRNIGSSDLVEGEADPRSNGSAMRSEPGEVTASSFQEGVEEDNHEGRALLGGESPKNHSRNHLKGSIAGVYSLAGGAGILLLTKLGGSLFDTLSSVTPFYMLAVFNIILLAVGVLRAIIEVLHSRSRSRQERYTR